MDLKTLISYERGSSLEQFFKEIFFSQNFNEPIRMFKKEKHSLSLVISNRIILILAATHIYLVLSYFFFNSSL
jgi:hypothetical protein